MPSSLESSRFVRYSLAATATAAAAGSGGAAVADVTSGSFNVSFGRSAGTNFFNGFSDSGGDNADVSLVMGDLSMGLFGYQATTFADADLSMVIADGNSNLAVFNQSYLPIPNGSPSSMLYGGGMVDAGAVWPVGSASTASAVTSIRLNIFWTYFNNASSTTSTWTNPIATGTKYINFLLEGDEGDIYGWMQFDWDITNAFEWSVSVSNWAYSDEGPLAAGSTGTPAVPGLGGLAALAVGAAGVRGRRQRSAG